MEEKEVVKIAEEDLGAVAGGVRYKDGVLLANLQKNIIPLSTRS